MKNVALTFAALVALPLAAAADVTKEDVRKLVAAGIGDEVIVSFIRANGPVQRMSADDVVELKQAGASERVLGALVGTPAPKAAPSVERVYVPQTTYVTSTPSYYYYSDDYYYPRYYPTYSYYPRYYSSSVYWGSRYYGYGGYRGHCGPRVGVSFGWRW